MHASQKLFERAQRVTPGGVNSPVRAFGSVGGTPVFIARAQGAQHFRRRRPAIPRLRRLMGASDPRACRARCGRSGHAGGALGDHVRSHHRTRGRAGGAGDPRWCQASRRCALTSSGTEATMSALRLARGFTQRDKVLKFSGCYHGHADAFLTEPAAASQPWGFQAPPASPWAPPPTP